MPTRMADCVKQIMHALIVSPVFSRTHSVALVAKKIEYQPTSLLLASVTIVGQYLDLIINRLFPVDAGRIRTRIEKLSSSGTNHDLPIDFITFWNSGKKGYLISGQYYHYTTSTVTILSTW